MPLMLDSYLERRLVSLDDLGRKSGFGRKITVFLLSAAFIFLLPYVHIGIFYSIWSPGKSAVDKATCSCNCFDTVFRGVYEWPPSGYKHFYFNATSETLRVWLLVVLGVIGLYECLRYVLSLVLAKSYRSAMLILLASALYPHYYGWWALINYLNEDNYGYYPHQIFFSLTELLSTIMVVHLANPSHRMHPWKLLVIMDINLMHIVVGGLDQFLENIVYHKAKGFEAVRDLALLMPDILHVLFPFFEMRQVAERQQMSVMELFYKEELLLSLLFIILGSLVGKAL